MDLLQQIRTGRAEKRRKPPFQPTLFTRVSGLVRRHGLNETFLRGLEASGELSREDEPTAIRLKRKAPYEPPLFSLSTEEEYRVALGILARVENPYLEYATSPDEILVCRSLFRQNPSLRPEDLARHHFETLLLVESAQRQIAQLTERVQAILDTGHADAEERSRLAALRKLMARVEDAGSPEDWPG